MRRDIELIKIILTNTEIGKGNDKIAGYEDQLVMYHQDLLKKSQYIDAIVLPNNNGIDKYLKVHIKNLT